MKTTFTAQFRRGQGRNYFSADNLRKSLSSENCTHSRIALRRNLKQKLVGAAAALSLESKQFDVQGPRASGAAAHSSHALTTEIELEGISPAPP